MGAQIMSGSTRDRLVQIARKGRGALSNPDGRFESQTHEAFDDGWDSAWPEQKRKTRLAVDHAKTVISRNRSPDVPFEQSINPYRGCEHGCIYCFARPTHAYLGLSPGLDFETRLFYKPDVAALLERELRKPGYRCSTITLGANTDCYQPIERKLRLTREILQVLSACNHPLAIVSKSALVERDIDILAPMAQRNLVQVYFSVTTLDSGLSRRMEPRATAPARRLEGLRRVAAAGIPTGVLVAPLIPALNDAELETILGACREAGAETAGYVTLRLPHELKTLFREWLAEHEPLKAARVLKLVQDLHGGKDYDSTFGHRKRGSGVVARALEDRFALACRQLGFNQSRRRLDCTQFRPPTAEGPQMDLGLEQE
ncbi:MAG: PA0069 family radical SAM protein [Gammaproteobacteria bacterium]